MVCCLTCPLQTQPCIRLGSLISFATNYAFFSCNIVLLIIDHTFWLLKVKKKNTLAKWGKNLGIRILTNKYQYGSYLVFASCLGLYKWHRTVGETVRINFNFAENPFDWTWRKVKQLNPVAKSISILENLNIIKITRVMLGTDSF